MVEINRAAIVDANFKRRVAACDLPSVPIHNLSEAGLDVSQLKQLFESQILSRLLDLHSRELQKRGESFYTIGSSGHEGNAAIAAAFRLDDMAFLHYRDAAFYIQRAKKLPHSTPMRDLLLSFAASKNDPISGGRHKVLGSKELYIPPQTSTIASHLPKAVGMASSIGLNRRLKRQGEVPHDSIVLCSFGDASLNHSTAQGAINSASWSAFQKIHMPIVFICEDNGIGISVPTPDGWVNASMSQKPGIKYFACNGLDFIETYRIAREAEQYTRKTRMPAFLHMRCIRLLGHAGADAQHTYLSEEQIEATEAHDPLLYTAAHIISQGIMSADEVITLYESTKDLIAHAAEDAIKEPKLETSQEVMASLIPPTRVQKVVQLPDTSLKDAFLQREKPRMEKPNNMARLINWALAELMLEHENIILAGEDVGAKGGVYSVTSGLQQQFGRHRVIDTLLDEQSILGLAIGMGQNGLLPIPEIQFLAYLHNAEDQLRGEAATLSFFSQGQYTNPMVVRIAGLAYQKGFGGHFHNDNSFAVLRDIPGIIIACPSNGADAVQMIRECVRLAQDEQRVVVFLEPIALYMTRDLHDEKDDGWSTSYLEARHADQIAIGEIGQYRDGTDLAIITYGNGYYLSRQAERELSQTHNLNCRIIDLRWLAPLSTDAIINAVEHCNNILIVDECRITGSISEALMAALIENLSPMPNLKRIAADDCFIPLGRAATATLPSTAAIVESALELINSNSGRQRMLAS